MISKTTLKYLPSRVIMARENNKPYMTRYYLLGGPRTNESDPDAQPTWGKLPFNLYLHHFHQGDDSPLLHNHPWRWSFSLILKGGYKEERLVDGKVVKRLYYPGSINSICAMDFHRVDLLEEDCWTLFLAGPKIASWGFVDRDTMFYIPWREYFNELH